VGKVARVGAFLTAVTLLGGCAGSLEDCPDRNSILSTKHQISNLPDGCRTSTFSGAGIAQVVCADGRQGFAVGGL
jgi:hypothetical protein